MEIYKKKTFPQFWFQIISLLTYFLRIWTKFWTKELKIGCFGVVYNVINRVWFIFIHTNFEIDSSITFRTRIPASWKSSFEKKFEKLPSALNQSFWILSSTVFNSCVLEPSKLFSHTEIQHRLNRFECFMYITNNNLV